MGSFFLKFIYFKWKIITLQYCNSFCHTSLWIGCRYTCVPSILKSLPPPSPPHPFRLLQSTGFGCAASYGTHTGHLLYIWYWACFNTILSNHPTLCFSVGGVNCISKEQNTFVYLWIWIMYMDIHFLQLTELWKSSKTKKGRATPEYQKTQSCLTLT